MQVTVTEWRLAGDSWRLDFLSILLWTLLGTTLVLPHQGRPGMHMRALLVNFWDLLLSLVDIPEDSEGISPGISAVPQTTTPISYPHLLLCAENMGK